MGKKKTVFVWILLVLMAIYLIFGAVNIVYSLININKLLTPALLSNPTINIINLVLSIIGLVIVAIFFVKLYNVRPDVLNWVNIAFGYSFATSLLNLVLLAFLSGLFAIFAAIPIIVILIFVGAMWFGISLHLKRAKRENLMDFS